MNEQSSAFRKTEVKPVERLTPHLVLCMADRIKGEDAKKLRAFSYYMMDDVRKVHELTKLLKQLFDLRGQINHDSVIWDEVRAVVNGKQEAEAK